MYIQTTVVPPSPILQTAARHRLLQAPWYKGVGGDKDSKKARAQQASACHKPKRYFSSVPQTHRPPSTRLTQPNPTHFLPSLTSLSVPFQRSRRHRRTPLTATAGVIIPSHDTFDRPQQSLEALLAQIRDLDLAAVLGRDDARSAGLVVQQGEFAEIVALAVALDDGVAAVAFIDLCLAALEDEEGFAGVALADDGGAGGELLRVEGVGDLGAFVEGQAREQGHLLQEALVHPPSLEGVVHQDPPERDPVQRPERALLLRAHDRRRPRRVVHQGQLAEAPSGPNRVDLLAHAVGPRGDLPGRVDVDVEDAALDDVEVVTRVALGDDFDVFRRDRLLDQGAEDDVGGLVVEVGEEEVGADGGTQAG